MDRFQSHKAQGEVHSLEKAELAKCTFAPKLCKKSVIMDKSTVGGGEAQRHEILRKKGEMSKGKKLILARERVTENEMKDCTFEPETNVKSSSEGSIRAGQRMYNRHMEKLKEKRSAPAMNSEDI